MRPYCFILNFKVCAAGGYLYALGGHEAPANTVGGRLACVERYDPVADTWVLLARLSYGRDAIGSCLLGDRIVAVGKDVNQFFIACENWLAKLLKKNVSCVKLKGSR